MMIDIKTSPKDFVYMGDLGLFVSTSPLKVRHQINWFEATEITHQLGLQLLTSAQCYKTRKYLIKHNYVNEDEYEKLIRYPGFTDSIIDFSWKVPILYEGNSVIRRDKGKGADLRCMDPIVKRGKKTLLPWLPIAERGYIQEFDEETMLPTKVGKEPNPDCQNAVLRYSGNLKQKLKGGIPPDYHNWNLIVVLRGGESVMGFPKDLTASNISLKVQPSLSVDDTLVRFCSNEIPKQKNITFTIEDRTQLDLEI